MLDGINFKVLIIEVPLIIDGVLFISNDVGIVVVLGVSYG